MIFNKGLTKNITLLHGDLNNWKYDENDKQYPTVYYLVFRFYEYEYEGYFSHKRLQEGDSSALSLSGNNELFDSFNQKIEDGDFLEEIQKACAEIWEDEKDSDD